MKVHKAYTENLEVMPFYVTKIVCGQILGGKHSIAASFDSKKVTCKVCKKRLLK